MKLKLGSGDVVFIRNPMRKSQFARLEMKLDRLLEGVCLLSEQLDALRKEVNADRDVMTSAATTITNLAQQIRENANDPRALVTLANDLETSRNALAAAIANTEGPALPTPEPIAEVPAVLPVDSVDTHSAPVETPAEPLTAEHDTL